MMDAGATTEATISTQCTIARAMLLSTCFMVVAWLALGRRRRGRGPRSSVGPDEIVPDCEHLSTDVFEFVSGTNGGQRLHHGWERLHARLVELEQRATGAANATSELGVQRSLDQLAGALIALRGALEADVRLRRRPEVLPELCAAGDELVVARCADVVITARALGGLRR